MTARKKVIIFTDGACTGNPGPGGYGVVLVYGGQRKELSGGYRRTTNNRMELTAAIRGLEALTEPCDVTLLSDSKYMVDSYNQGSVMRWRANSWMRDRKSPAQNVDLWEQLLALCSQHHVTFQWVEGHAGNPENERCDRLSVQAAHSQGLPADEAYEQGVTRTPSQGTLKPPVV